MKTMLLALAAAVCAAQEPAASAWTATGEGGEVRGDRSAFTFHYELGARKVAAAILPTPAGVPAMRSLRFRARTGHATAIGVMLGEKKPGGGNYTAWFWSPGGTWQSIELRPSDFIPSDGPKDPVDSNDRLDLDQVEGIGFLDFAVFKEMFLDAAKTPLVVDRLSGKHSLEVEKFEISGAAGESEKPDGNHIAIDLLDRPFLQWITLGGMMLRRSAPPNPLDAPTILATYSDPGDRLVVLTRPVAPGTLAKTAGLSFEIASEREAAIMVGIELTRSGSGPAPRYHLSVFPPGRKESFQVNVLYNDFEAEASAGGVPIDPARIKSITLADATAASGGVAAANTIWVGRLEALPQ